tara:strand:- start:430 stop:627 length:198 start_codon:yes stop_codon:yes gene_type:complete
VQGEQEVLVNLLDQQVQIQSMQAQQQLQVQEGVKVLEIKMPLLLQVLVEMVDLAVVAIKELVDKV